MSLSIDTDTDQDFVPYGAYNVNYNEIMNSDIIKVIKQSIKVEYRKKIIEVIKITTKCLNLTYYTDAIFIDEEGKELSEKEYKKNISQVNKSVQDVLIGLLSEENIDTILEKIKKLYETLERKETKLKECEDELERQADKRYERECKRAISAAKWNFFYNTVTYIFMFILFCISLIASFNIHQEINSIELLSTATLSQYVATSFNTGLLYLNEILPGKGLLNWLIPTDSSGQGFSFYFNITLLDSMNIIHQIIFFTKVFTEENIYKTRGERLNHFFYRLQVNLAENLMLLQSNRLIAQVSQQKMLNGILAHSFQGYNMAKTANLLPNSDSKEIPEEKNIEVIRETIRSELHGVVTQKSEDVHDSMANKVMTCICKKFKIRKDRFENALNKFFKEVNPYIVLTVLEKMINLKDDEVVMIKRVLHVTKTKDVKVKNRALKITHNFITNSRPNDTLYLQQAIWENKDVNDDDLDKLLDDFDSLSLTEQEPANNLASLNRLAPGTSENKTLQIPPSPGISDEELLEIFLAFTDSVGKE